MVPIYICEDQKIILEQLRSYIEESCMIGALDFSVSAATDSPYELLRLIRENPKQGIYFLDVDLSTPDMNGFELGKQIRTIDPRGFIVYVTSHSELLPETFKYRVEALDYILKDNPEKMKQDIRSALKDIQELLRQPQHTKRTPVFTVETAAHIRHVPVSTIQYFETSVKKHVAALVTADEYIEFYSSLNKLADQFSDSFIRVHQSYLVNKAHIQGVDKKNKLVILQDNSTCLVARNKLKTVQSFLEENKL